MIIVYIKQSFNFLCFYDFLCKCIDSNVIGNCLNFVVANNHLKYSFIYKQCQSNLLKEEFGLKKSAVQFLQKEISFFKVSLQTELDFVDSMDFVHISTLQN